MIVGFRCKKTEQVHAGYSVKGIPGDIVPVLQRKLAIMDAALNLNDLRVPPANHLEALKGDRKGQHSIRVSGKWRLCFVWTSGGPDRVELVDYH